MEDDAFIGGQASWNGGSTLPKAEASVVLGASGSRARPRVL